ncbi:MAG: S-layer homology domain-containing protein [Oscillospiraceae bacterium]|jgi:hypothetical protein|nr:S-layer homology domain-containing protein [Oscillospiraceae bacterium]MDE7011239.1 S-layer homology domain-containing protein [Oscillospiraceae bacterium]
MKKAVLRSLTSALCALVLVLGLIPSAQAAGTPAVSDNALDNCYGFNANAVKSYLYINASGGLTRVEALTNKEIVVEDYSPSFALLSQRTIPGELEYYAGFFPGQSYNFFVFVQRNNSESDSVEVVRVVKYDKSWNRLGHASVYGANTRMALSNSTLRCAEAGGMLYVHTGHQMYKSSDGYNHQANMNIVVRQNDMQVTETGYGVGGYNNYVSHSFNQFIMADSLGNLLTLNQGDGHPRALVIHKLSGKAGSESMICTPSNPAASVQTERFDGPDGENQTNVWTGGMAETSTGYLMAYAQRKLEGQYVPLPLTQMKLAYISKADFKTGATFQIRQLTANTKTSQVEGTPFLVPTGPDGGWILWNSVSNPAPDYTEVNEGLRYATYSADGSVGPVQKLNKAAPLSDCQPIYYNGKVVWYVTSSSAPVFYCLDASGVTATPANGFASQVVGEAGSVPPTRLEGNGVSFSDVPASHPAYNDIASCVAMGAVSGYTDGTFHPDEQVTYAQIAAMAGKLFYQKDLEKFQADPQYAGKPWYVPVMEMATGFQSSSVMYNLYYVRGYTEEYANKPLPRGDLATIISRIASDKKGYGYYKDIEYLKSQVTDYTEGPSVKGEHWGEALACVHTGLLNLKSDGSFGMFDTVTRAEACTALVRVFDFVYG